jgi:hypothetical protein
MRCVSQSNNVGRDVEGGEKGRTPVGQCWRKAVSRDIWTVDETLQIRIVVPSVTFGCLE